MLYILFASIIAALVGLAFCFCGYRIFLVLLPIWGFFAGFWLGATVISMIFGGGFLGTVTGIVVGFIAGIIFAVLSYLFYIVGVAIIAGAIGGVLSSGIMGALGFDPGFLTTIFTIAGAILVGILALIWNLQRYVISVIFAVIGAAAVVLSALLLFGQTSLDLIRAGNNLIEPILQASWLAILAWLILAVAGFVYQLLRDRDFAFTKDRYVEAWG